MDNECWDRNGNTPRRQQSPLIDQLEKNGSPEPSKPHRARRKHGDAL